MFSVTPWLNIYMDAIRECEERDLPAVLGLMQQLSEFTTDRPQFKLEHFQRLLAEMSANPQVYYNLVCEVDGRVSGFLSLIFYRSLFHTGGTALINELVVDRNLRGRGLGRQLVEAAMGEARRRGMDEIEVGTEKDNLSAQDFYRKTGFDEEYVLMGMEFGED